MDTQKSAVELAKDKHKSWVDEITAAERESRKFHERARKVVKRFLDERDVITAENKWFNIFYANTGILQAALYSQPPKPIVSRKFKDYDDDVARVAAVILQRCITQDLDDPADTFDTTVRNAIFDRLVPGVATAWVRLETDTEKAELPEPQPGMETEAEEGEEELLKISDQRVCVDYVYWEDFIWSPCRVWEERRWTGRAVYMDRDGLIERFGEEKGKLIPLDWRGKPNRSGSGGEVTPDDSIVQKAKIYELWVRDGKKVIWVSKAYPEVLDEESDPLKLSHFEPCPRPMMANLSTSNCMPRPDFYMIQDQYTEMDTLNQRISKLIEACKVVGVYDKGSPGVARMLKEGFDNDLIPVDNWAMFAEKGGIKGQIDWLPLEQVVAALQQLNVARDQIKQQIYELTGIADIVRGATKASETLGAQEIKAKFASIRIQRLQGEVARFVGDILRIKAEIMVRHFEPEILKRISNIDQTPDAEFADQALALLTHQDTFEWRIQVTADSIAQADYDMEKRDRVEFMTAVSSYLEKAAGMFQSVPQSAPLLVGMLKWVMAGFRNAQEVEGMIDQALDALVKNPPQDKPDPEAQKAQVEAQKQDREFMLKQQEQQDNMQMEAMRLQMEAQAEKQRLAMEAQQMQMKAYMEQQMMLLKLWFESQMSQVKLGAAQSEAAVKAETQAQQSAQSLEQQALSHEQTMEQKNEAAQVDIANKKAAAAAAPKESGNASS